MLNFLRWTPTLGVFPKWNNQKVPKIAHLGIFRHIGGSGGSKKMWTSKYSGSRVIVAKIADIGPPRAPQYFFQKKTSNVWITVHLDVYHYNEVVLFTEFYRAGWMCCCNRRRETLHPEQIVFQTFIITRCNSAQCAVCTVYFARDRTGWVIL